MSDDHAYQAISAYGHGLNNTPNIDRLAREGVIFNNACVTNSICAQQGGDTYRKIQPPERKGGQQDEIRLESAQLSGIAATIGLPDRPDRENSSRRNSRGFDYWNVLPGQGQYYNPDFIEMGVKSESRVIARN